jgi:outer membrane immunogenic protein
MGFMVNALLSDCRYRARCRCSCRVGTMIVRQRTHRRLSPIFRAFPQVRSLLGTRRGHGMASPTSIGGQPRRFALGQYLATGGRPGLPRRGQLRAQDRRPGARQSHLGGRCQWPGVKHEVCERLQALPRRRVASLQHTAKIVSPRTLFHRFGTFRCSESRTGPAKQGVPMRKILLASIAGAALLALAPAHAADLGRPVYKAPPPVVPPVPFFSWTGCYIGGHIGGGWGRKDFTDSPDELFFEPAESVHVDTSGFLGGGQVGCDWQLTPNWVIGIEGAAAWADLKGDASVSPDQFLTETFHAKTDFLASVTGRIGWAWDRWLLYAKGGVAWDRDKYDIDFAFSGEVACIIDKPCPEPPLAASETRTGWTVGGGVEWAFWNNWSAKLEYNFYDFGTHRVDFVDTLGQTFPIDVDQRIHTVKFGINYRFNWGKAPVVARY